MNINFFFRKSYGSYFSIEKVFQTVIDNLDHPFEGTSHTCPFISEGFFKRLGNLIYYFIKQGKINHITGDVHYLALIPSSNTTILTIHDCRTLKRLKGIKRLVFKLFWFILPIRFSDAITVISNFQKKELLQEVNCDSNKIHVIYDPLPKGFVYSPRLFNQEKPRILQIGTGENKNIERVTEALTGINCTLEIIGRLSSDQQIKLEKHNIHYENYYHLSNDEIIQRYKACDFVIFTSTYEGFGMPIIEAQAIGRPIVTSNIAPLPEVGGGGACYVDPFSIASIKIGVEQVIADEEFRQEIIRQGLINAKRFEAKHIAKEYCNLYSYLTKDL